MSAYRFCRSDDIPLLVRAHEDCYRAHFPDLPALSADDLKRAVRELGVWTSSCMVALEGRQPVGVLIAAKGERENLIYRIGVHPDHLRKGHGRHMLDSLRQKMAILRPPRMVAELPVNHEAGRSFLEASGYEVEGDPYTDFVLQRPDRSVRTAEAVFPVTFDDLLDQGLFRGAQPRCWQRETERLAKIRERLGGLALASGERIEGYLLYHAPSGTKTREIVALGAADGANAAAVLGLLVRQFCGSDDRPVRMRRVAPGEIALELLASWGFDPRERTARYVAQPE